MFDKLLDKATSPLLLEPDWETILRLCDVVKSLAVTPKHAVQLIKKKLRHDNPHVILHALQCLESIVKNCGTPIHKEVAQKDVIEVLKQLVKNGPEQIRAKVLELIQCWSHGLGQQYKIFTDTFHLLKHENYRFPPMKQSEAMFENENVPPEWKDDKQCFRCRQTFTTFIRKHHCRACGEIFCDKCSARYCPLPKFGFDRYVRVCESCYEKLPTGVSIKPKPASARNKTKCQIDIDEEDTLQLALAISRSEADEKERQKKILTQKYATSNAESNKEIEQNEHEETSDVLINDKEIDQFTMLVTDHINNFKLRMLSNQQRHRNIINDTAVQSIFLTLQYSYPELHRFMQLLEEKEGYYENLQDKLNQLKDAREALNALRCEYYEQKQQEALECERQRQIQLAQKLDFMRQKKQEYLEYQRQIHLQYLAQEEMEMKNHLEHQRQLTLAREQCSQNSHLVKSSYTPNTDTQFYPINVTEDSNYFNATNQVPLINSTIPYIQQSIPMIASESRLILLD